MLARWCWGRDAEDGLDAEGWMRLGDAEDYDEFDGEDECEWCVSSW